jgi:enoyl-CoA hydratase
MSEPVRYERTGAAAVVTIDRPERRNAVDGSTADALGAAYRRFVADDEARVLVLTGAGGVAFCAGADLKALDTFGPRLGDPAGPLGFTRLHSPKPTIAAISGWCLAGGLELALWCDLRVASETAVFGVYCRRWGVPLIDGGTIRLPRIIGQGRAMELVITGRGVAAQEALQIGLANRVTEQGKALETAQQWAAEIAALPQLCLRHDRLSLLQQWGMAEDVAIANEWQHGMASLAAGVGGAQRFVSGEGRRGS